MTRSQTYNSAMAAAVVSFTLAAVPFVLLSFGGVLPHAGGFGRVFLSAAMILGVVSLAAASIIFRGGMGRDPWSLWQFWIMLGALVVLVYPEWLAGAGVLPRDFAPHVFSGIMALLCAAIWRGTRAEMVKGG